MIKNLFVVAFRNLKRYPGYSLLNIFGLMIGITFSLFLIFYIRDELSFDKYHSKADRIYRVTREFRTPDGKPVLHPNDLNDQVRNSHGALKFTVVDPARGTKSIVDVNLSK